jgi:hypothetical protein
LPMLQKLLYAVVLNPASTCPPSQSRVNYIRA